ncbi:molybdopterin binding domain protein [Blumeria hordei DH14]|uniref:Molybdopterin binding domain protein n=1 Tax=Blumeria graminis f. sp. hordei (strain DH14) TaxID=546991 RepID=N1J6T7_BLUG1|nr:molybdopterin binding domain protein [Blumeria hordei DH14]
MSLSIEDRQSRNIHTAACLVIGDEVLGGKASTRLWMYVTTNSAYFAKFCFRLGIVPCPIQFLKIEVIADDSSEIIEAVRRMSNNYDFVVTSGGIGPTHDDITYQSIASAFSLPLSLHQETFSLMKKLSKPHPSQLEFSWDVPSPALTAKKRMAQLPIDNSRSLSSQVLFPCDDLWVPVCCVNGNIYILPGIPRLFQKLLEGLQPILLPRLDDPNGEGVVRILISTPLAESEVAGFLSGLAERVADKGVKVGSYPRWGKSRNTVSLVGRDKEFMESLVDEVEKNVMGKRVSVEGEDDSDVEEKKA